MYSSYGSGSPGYSSSSGSAMRSPHSQDSYLQRPDFHVPDQVEKFIIYFHQQLLAGNTYELFNVFEGSFNKLTDRYFTTSPWPPVEAIAPIVDNDQYFLILYKELYFRHIYSKFPPTIEQRFKSWKNYCELFDFLLHPDTVLPGELPGQWLWDIVDEFIYQFQSFCQYRSKLDPNSEEFQVLKVNEHVWNVLGVLNYLHAFIKHSGVVALLDKDELSFMADRGMDRMKFMFAELGYFSMIGLLRLHTLMGDYSLALKSVGHIDLSKRGFYTRVPACHVTLFYYVGFSYLMLRRYVDAIRTFATILLDIKRTRQYHTRSYQHEQIFKRNDQMYALIAIAVSLCPQRVDENIHGPLQEKYSEKMLRMQRGDENVFKELFSSACPKFITPAMPVLDPDTPPTNRVQEARALQQKLFLTEVKQQLFLPTMRSYLKLYTTLSISKLAQFLQVSEDVARTHVMCMKHKSRNVVFTKGSLLDGELRNTSDVDFYVDEEMIHIGTSKAPRRFGEYFVRHINKFDEIIGDLERLPTSVPEYDTGR